MSLGRWRKDWPTGETNLAKLANLADGRVKAS
jgi:hypothetical protein